jgi:hypothetical protein
MSKGCFQNDYKISLMHRIKEDISTKNVIRLNLMNDICRMIIL